VDRDRCETVHVHVVLQETIRQQEWKIERLTKDNRALEASNCELRAQLEALKEENLQVRPQITGSVALEHLALCCPRCSNLNVCMVACHMGDARLHML
jgi:predicted RNase H-like nuclease (RuvC/YqgF family)